MHVETKQVKTNLYLDRNCMPKAQVLTLPEGYSTLANKCALSLRAFKNVLFANSSCWTFFISIHLMCD